MASVRLAIHRNRGGRGDVFGSCPQRRPAPSFPRARCTLPGAGTFALMPRTHRLELRVTPYLADKIKQASEPLSLSRWLEVAALEKLERDSRGLGLPAETHTREYDFPEPSNEPPLQRQDEQVFPRRPPPRMTGGRKQR
jgi:hypothetical protein